MAVAEAVWRWRRRQRCGGSRGGSGTARRQSITATRTSKKVAVAAAEAEAAAVTLSATIGTLVFQRTHTLCALIMQRYCTVVAGILHCTHLSTLSSFTEAVPEILLHT